MNGLAWLLLLVLLFCSSLPALAQPANDDPCGAVNLPINALCVGTAGTLQNATVTGGIPAPGCGYANTKDVWYKVTIPVSGAVTINTTANAITDGGMAAYSAAACGGPFTLIACNDDQTAGNAMPKLDLTCQTAGAVIYIRFWKSSGGGNTFNICAVTLVPAAPPVNDGPCGAVLLPVNPGCVNTAGTTVGACPSIGPPAPSCDNYQGADVWYRFVVPAGGSVTITTTAGTITDGALSIYSATACGGVFTELVCNDNGAGMPVASVSCRTAGTTLYVRFWQSGGGTGTFSICASVGPAVPANDDPCGATVLPAGATCVNTASTTAGACNSAVAVPSCGNYNGSDVWFRVVTGSVGTLTLTGSAGTMTDGAMALYTATACAGVFTEVACNDNGAAMPQIVLANQPAGTYYIRFWQPGGGTGTFSICATLVPPPANDDPCGAIVLATNAACVLSAGTNVAATNTAGPPNPTCANYSGPDVWYVVTTTSTGTLTMSTTAGTMTDGGMSIYTATACNGTFTQVTCDDDSGPGNMPQITLNCQAAATFYVRMWQYGGGTGTFNICAQFVAGLTNDDECNASTLAVNTTCVNTAGDNTGACHGTAAPAPGCGNYSATAHDIWYKFIAPASGIAIIETTAGTLTDAAMAVYSGACGTLTLVQCDDDSGPGTMPTLNLSGLTAGNTYYVRLWGYGSAQGTFNICVHAPTMPVGTSCVYSLEMFDTGTDGWGTSNVSVSINGGAATSYTVTAGYNIILIGVNIGDVIVFTYTNTGANQNQNSYTIKLLGSTVPYFTSGSPPANGIAYFGTVNCVSPPASQSDCIGARTVCGSQSFNANPSGTGNIVDLNSSNYGCLASSERQGIWYIYKVSSGGNIGMTISPVSTDDYDWAIWGPYASNSTTSSVCAPSGPPIRCSYASGPNTFAATGSYNTGMGSATYSPPQFANPNPAVTEGAGGDGWVSGLIATTGQVYLLYVSNFSQSGLAFNLSWQLSGGSSLDCTVLPVELLSLAADVDGENIVVRWSTATEHNSDYFSVERSADGADFKPIGAMDAAGDSQQRIDYLYTDVFPLKGANYYRLKQVDIDGQFVYTYTVVAVQGHTGAAPLLFPNPAKGSLHVAFDMPTSGQAVAEVVDGSGRTVRSYAFTLEHGQRTMDIDVTDLGPGVYQFRLSTGEDIPASVTQFVKE